MKRFTETLKWGDPWYRKLSCRHKALWSYICDKCDNAGVWKVDYDLASFQIGERVSEADMAILNDGKERVVIKKDLIIVKDFIPFQIGDLTGENLTNLQKSCLILLSNYSQKGIDLTGKLRVSYPKPTGKGKGKDKDKDKDKDKIYNILPSFHEIWMSYPKRVGKKQALRHFLSSVKTDTDMERIRKALTNYLKSERVYKGYIMNGATWFNNWEDWADFKEEVCPKCKGKGKYMSSTGYEIVCDCPKGRGRAIYDSVDQASSSTFDDERC